MASERIAVVGTGRLGSCLVRALHRAGLTVSALASAEPEHARRLVEELGSSARVTTAQGAAACAELIFLAVPDANIADVARTLALTQGQALVHTSGALDRVPLMAAGGGGASLGVFHPLQAFPPNAPPEHFHGISVGIDAPPELFERLRELAQRLGAQAFSLGGVDRAGYHAAAVFASNYVVALQAVAARIWESAGLPIESARPALAALTRGAADNLSQHELTQALTGPLARGDAATVGRHLHFLAGDPASLQLYRGLARELLALPLELPAASRAALEALLRDVV